MLPAAIILASINIRPEQWLTYSTSDKERLINGWFQQQTMAATAPQRLTMVVTIDDYARCATGSARPAGVVQWDEASGRYIDDTTVNITGSTDGASTGSGSSGNNSPNALDPTTTRGSQFWQSALSGAFSTATSIFNGINANDQARIRAEAASRLTSTQQQYDNARNSQERAFYGQQLDFMRQIANRGSATAGWIALGIAGMVVLGGVVYATSRSSAKK